MAVLYYLLGFLSGLAAVLIVLLILSSRRRKLSEQDELGRAFDSILKY